jgi:hypothetical protein
MDKEPPAIECLFTFKCPMTWDSLKQIEGAPNVRYCGHCEHTVHLCTNHRELQKHAEKLHCVAYVHEQVSRDREFTTVGVLDLRKFEVE